VARCRAARRLPGALLWLVSTFACAAPTRRQCELEPPELVARSTGLSFDGVAVTGSGADLAYAWSEQSGLFVRQADAVQLGARCRGGIDALRAGQALYVACSRPAEDGGEVVVYQVGKEAVTVGNAGRDGHGVSLAALGDRVYVAFHEGALGDHAVWLAQLGAAPVRLSTPGHAAREPSLVAHAGHLYTAFAELELAAGPASQLLVSRDGAKPQRLASPRAFSPTPKLSADAQGVVLGYRDLGREGKRSELRVVRLDASGKVAGPATSVGRANDAGEPNLYGCGSLVTALLPREYGGERYVGIHALDGELSALGAGHQLYQTGHDFVLANGSCDGAGLRLIAADRAAPSRPGVQAVSLRFRCN
jgi:hypothetical protein